MRKLCLVFWALLLVDGVFGVEKVEVMKGDSVTLNPHTVIPEDDSAEWWFGGKIIADMNKANGRFSTSEGDDVGFKDKLNLDKQTGSLTITNVTPEHAGLYKLQIMSTTQISKIFSVTVHEINILSVEEGNDVTLQTDTKTQRDDQMLWMYGPESIPIAEINKVSKFYEDVLDGRFRGRLKLDHQTGDLTITNTRTTDTGVYKLQTSSREATKYTRFVVTVSGSGWFSGVLAIVVGVLVVMFIAAFAGCMYYRWKVSKL